MNKVREDMLNELKMIEKECFEKGISASEWIERYAEEYARKNGYGRHAKEEHA